MKQLCAAVFFAFAPIAAVAQQDAFAGVIEGQIEAFLADDMETAFGFAAPGIQSMFRTPETFGRMVQQGYPMVWRPDTVEYLSARQTERGWMQDILITDASGRLHRLAYLMLETADGWKIGGVQVVTAPDVGA
ncbi:hypothetical protein JANAI62_16970 [Jannaschia pagri]|uniref:DUF4864 domain-containing protein n=1 Tax=Jannaschia pagri TaxID=2829797 RepID=A0ABQ4NL12_9RHOB|nr:MULTISPECIES: DUF4864 domain-containing protein [unclassified Jannaschia]GIT91242.1 hypothetical protein JANAI61_17000 [Jannaschia sp. AI_61]GIT95074.1 hypothetical protein JANAI62_16970 [Jannaschia sp. AI_62]